MYRRPRYLVSAAIGLLFCLSIASSHTLVRASENCETLRAWARPFANRSLTLAQFLAYDAGQQRAIFGEVTPGVRAALWREHLNQIAQRPEFTTRQRAAIVAISVAATSEVYAGNAAARERMRELRKEHEAAFGREQLLIFYRLSRTAPLAQEGGCDCMGGTGLWECYPLGCGGPVGCTARPGCGWMGMDICDGKCQ